MYILLTCLPRCLRGIIHLKFYMYHKDMESNKQEVCSFFFFDEFSRCCIELPMIWKDIWPWLLSLELTIQFIPASSPLLSLLEIFTVGSKLVLAIINITLMDGFTIFQLKAVSDAVSCSYWLLKDPLQMCFQCKWWGPKSTVCPHGHLKVNVKLIWDFSSLS